MSKVLIKYSSTSCGLCKRMSFHDRRVAEELGLLFEECYPETVPEDPNVELFLQYVRTSQEHNSSAQGEARDSELYGWPTYLLADKSGSCTYVLAKYQGAAPKARFREIISELMNSCLT